MSCEQMQPELVAYHFGLVDDGRRELEEHLMSCPSCLRSFLDLKRDLETAETGPEPSPAVLQRLRASAGRELGLSAPRRWSWWERPLAVGVAAAVVLIATAAVARLP